MMNFRPKPLPTGRERVVLLSQVNGVVREQVDLPECPHFSNPDSWFKKRLETVRRREAGDGDE